MMILFPIIEAVRSGSDLENLGGNSKYSKMVVCPDGCVIFKHQLLCEMQISIRENPGKNNNHTEW